MERQTTLDSILDWLKDHPVSAWVIFAGIFVIGVGNVVASVEGIGRFLWPPVAQSATVNSLPVEEPNKDCKYLHMTPIVPSALGGPPPAESYGFDFERITADGPELVISSLQNESRRFHPQTLTLKHFVQGDYRIKIEYRPPAMKGGTYNFHIGPEQYYLLSLDRQSAAGFKVEAIPPVEASKFLEEHRPRILDCRFARPGLTWVGGDLFF